MKFHMCRSSRREVFCKKVVLRNLTKFTGKHLCQSLFFFNKVAGQRPATLLKKRLLHRCFPVNFVKILRTPFYIEHLWWLLLYVQLSNIELHHNTLLQIIKPGFHYGLTCDNMRSYLCITLFFFIRTSKFCFQNLAMPWRRMSDWLQ